MLQALSIRSVIVGVVLSAITFAPIPVVAEPPVHSNPPGGGFVPVPEVPVVDPEQMIPAVFSAIWGLPSANTMSYVLTASTQDNVSFSIRVLLSTTGQEIDSGAFTSSERIALPNTSRMMTSALQQAAAGTAASAFVYEASAFICTGQLTGSSGSRLAVLFGTTLSRKSQANALIEQATIFTPYCTAPTLTECHKLAIDLAGIDAMDALARNGGECTLSAPQLAALSCEERAGYNNYCSMESCRKNEALCAAAATSGLLLAGTACLSMTVGFGVCMALAAAGFALALFFCHQVGNLCRNDATRAYNTTMADCLGLLHD